MLQVLNKKKITGDVILPCVRENTQPAGNESSEIPSIIIMFNFSLPYSYRVTPLNQTDYNQINWNLPFASDRLQHVGLINHFYF